LWDTLLTKKHHPSDFPWLPATREWSNVRHQIWMDTPGEDGPPFSLPFHLFFLFLSVHSVSLTEDRPLHSATLATKYAWARRRGYHGIAFWASGGSRMGPKDTAGEGFEMWDAVSAFGPLN
jgi:hypothetical protein